MALPDEQTLWLLLVLLLLLWLLTRERRHRAQTHERRRPISEDELGRVVFELARATDLEGFRHLYLSGGEARQVLGERAGAYLEARLVARWLEDELVEIAARLADRQAYVATRVAADGMAWMRVRGLSGAEDEIPIGHAVRVGLIWRLQDPVGDWKPYGKANATA